MSEVSCVNFLGGYVCPGDNTTTCRKSCEAKQHTRTEVVSVPLPAYFEFIDARVWSLRRAGRSSWLSLPGFGAGSPKVLARRLQAVLRLESSSPMGLCSRGAGAFGHGCSSSSRSRSGCGVLQRLHSCRAGSVHTSGCATDAR